MSEAIEMKGYQSCSECPYRIRETSPLNDTDVGDFEYYLVIRSVDFVGTRLGYNWSAVGDLDA